MSSRRLGMLILALVAVWMVTGSSWHPESPTVLATSLVSPEKACAGDLSGLKGSCTTFGDPDDIADSPADSPDSTQAGNGGSTGDKSLLNHLIDALGSLLGLR